jgi:hypothetical protein
LWLSFLASSNLSCVATKNNKQTSNAAQTTRVANVITTVKLQSSAWNSDEREACDQSHGMQEKLTRTQICVPFAVALFVLRVSPPSSAAKGCQDRELAGTSSDVSADQARTKCCSQQVHLQVVQV